MANAPKQVSISSFAAVKLWQQEAEWDAIADVTFHDVRHDVAHWAREAGWRLEDIAYYLGHITKKGTPAI